ncbi:Uncharacterised protein [Clostridioides difficile]|nr:Uncharacterised protein [Clostridioides difficile]
MNVNVADQISRVTAATSTIPRTPRSPTCTPKIEVACSPVDRPCTVTAAGMRKTTTTHRQKLRHGSLATSQIDTYIRPRARDREVAPAMVISAPMMPKVVADVGSSIVGASRLLAGIPSSVSASSTTSVPGRVSTRITIGRIEVKACAASVIDRSVRFPRAMSMTMRSTREAPGSRITRSRTASRSGRRMNSPIGSGVSFGPLASLPAPDSFGPLASLPAPDSFGPLASLPAPGTFHHGRCRD